MWMQMYIELAWSLRGLERRRRQAVELPSERGAGKWDV